MFKPPYSIIIGVILAVVCVVLGATVYQTFRGETPLAGNFQPVQGLPFTVSKTVLPTDTTITLSSFKADGYPLTMSSFGSIAYGTLDPNNTARIESISFTGITQNGDGSATLTGVSRGLASTYPYAASTTLEQTHLVGSQFILSNTAAFYGQQFLFANQTGTSSAVIVFASTTPPRYDLDPGAAAFTAAASSTLIDQAQLNRAVLSGCANGTSVLQGCVQLATAKQAASSTVTGSTGANDVLASAYATDTPSTSGCATSGGCVVMSLLNGKLSQLWYDFTQQFTFTGGLSSTGTTTITDSNINTNPLKLNGLAYVFPSSRGASSTVLLENGSGGLTFESPSNLVSATTSASVNYSTSANGIATGVAYCVSPAVAIGGGVTTSGAVSTGDDVAGAYSLLSIQTVIVDNASSTNTSAWQGEVECSAQGSSATCSSGSFTVTAECLNP